MQTKSHTNAARDAGQPIINGSLILEIEGDNLAGADLADADLTDADLQPIRNDFLKAISCVPSEIPGLRLALTEGRIDGSPEKSQFAALAIKWIDEWTADQALKEEALKEEAR
jgi:hypothetical protein